MKLLFQVYILEEKTFLVYLNRIHGAGCEGTEDKSNLALLDSTLFVYNLMIIHQPA